MKWNVYYHNFNRKEIEVYNIFNHHNFRAEVEEHLKECINKEEFAEKLRRSLSYYFRAKAEWEIVLTSWTPHIDTVELKRLNAEYVAYVKEWGKEPYSFYVQPNVFEKIDVYSQVMNNWDIFVDCCWEEKDNGCNK